MKFYILSAVVLCMACESSRKKKESTATGPFIPISADPSAGGSGDATDALADDPALEESDVVEAVVEDEVVVAEDVFVVNASDEQIAYLAFTSCLDAKNKTGSTTSGIYKLYYTDANNQVQMMDAYCDMENEGGGWTQILNYVHLGGTNPPLNVREDSFPLYNSNTLGDDEQDSAFWGHLSPALLSNFQFTEMRFYCVSEASSNTILHFKTDLATCLDYAKTGAGSCNGVQNNNFEALTDHNARLPGANTNGEAESANLALTDTTLRSENDLSHWSIKSGQNDDDWECDDDIDNASLNTIHRMWVR